MIRSVSFEALLTIMSLTVTAVSRACGAEATVAVASKEETPMQIEDALSGFSLQTNVPIDLSADGEWIAYTLIDPHRKKTLEEERYVFFTPTGVPRVGIAGDVWITNTRTGEAKNLTGGKGSSWAPSWSPNGHYLVFYSDRSGHTQVWLWERSSGRLRPAAEVIARPYFGFHVLRWTPNSRQVLCRVLPEGLSLEEASRLITGTPEAPANQRETTVTLFRSPAPADQGEREKTQKADYTNIQLSDLALLDVGTGKVRRLVRRVKLDGYWISPDGIRVAYTCYKGPDPADPFFARGDLVVLSLLDGHSHVAASVRSKQQWQSVSWSPDSRWLSYVVGGPDVPGDCFIVNPDGGQARCLTPAPHPSFGGLLRAPLWDPQGRSVYLLGDNALWKADIVAGTVSAVTRIPGQHILEVIAPSGGGRFWSPDGGNSLYLATRDDEHRRIAFYRIDLITGQPTKGSG